MPRTSGALGFTMQVDEDEHFLTTAQEMRDKISVLCGGGAEEIIFGEVTNGASNDIEKATQIARAMVTQFGMSDRFGMVNLGTQRNRYLGGPTEYTCSEGTAVEIDAEVQRLVEEGHQRALEILKAHRFKLHEISRYLQRKETITGEDGFCFVGVNGSVTDISHFVPTHGASLEVTSLGGVPFTWAYRVQGQHSVPPRYGACMDCMMVGG